MGQDINKKYKLTIELIPSSSFFNNLRSLLEKEEWDKIRKACYKKANYKCEICGGKGPAHPVECHETWDYDEEKGIQKLLNVIALCPSCHQVKHIGLASINGKLDEAIAHFCKVNECTKEEAQKYISDIFDLWKKRSEKDWDLDVTLLEELKK